MPDQATLALALRGRGNSFRRQEGSAVDRLQLERAIERLPPGYRMIFVLHDIEGFEHNEIAQIVGCSIGNSKSQLHKARLKLREYLKFMRAEKAKTA